MAGEDEGKETGEESQQEGKEGKEEKEEKPGPPTIEDALARAREVLEKKGTMMGMADEKEGDKEEDADGDKEEKSGEEDEEEEAGEEKDGDDEEGAEDEEGEGSDADDADDEVGDEEKEESEEKEEEEEGEEKKPITVSVPGRHPNSEDIELEVEDEEIAERLAHLKSGFLRGEEVREREQAMTASEDAMADLSEAFDVDPAGFVLEYTDKKELGGVVLALLTEPGVWEDISTQVDKLFSDTGEMRTLRAEVKADRLEAREKLQKRSVRRKANAESGRKLGDAIDLMVPETIEGAKREQLITDLTRDTTDHITRNKLDSLDVKDLVTVLAGRLETNGIDPLDARKAVQSGSRSRAKTTTKKRPRKKAKTGQELAKASAKRKSVAAAPGPGKKAAPTQPTKLPAGMTIKQSIDLARKKGLAAFLPDK